jgi:hypothetical protein
MSNISEIKTTSDGTVKISVEKYNELLERAARKPVVINKTSVIKTEAMVAKELRMWGGGLMGLGASMFVVGAILFKAGR